MNPTMAMNAHRNATEQAYLSEQARIEREIRSRRPGAPSLADATATVERIATRLAALATPSLAEQVERELARPGNERLLAVVNDDGDVQTIMVPAAPYYVRNSDELSALKEHADSLRRAIDNPRTSWTQRTRLEQQLRDLEGRITAARLDPTRNPGAFAGMPG